MTIAAIEGFDPPVHGGDVVWRALPGGLRVARMDGRHLGSIEQGRRWSAAGADGEPIGAYRSLREAQAAVEDPDRASAKRSTRSYASTAAGAIAVLSVAAVLSVVASIWIGLLL